MRCLCEERKKVAIVQRVVRWVPSGVGGEREQGEGESESDAQLSTGGQFRYVLMMLWYALRQIGHFRCARGRDVICAAQPSQTQR